MRAHAAASRTTRDQASYSPLGRNTLRGRHALGRGENRALEKSARAEVPQVVTDVLRSPGEPLDGETRRYFDQRFSHDFGRVRIHRDGSAAASAKAIDALAYTAGSSIVFGQGRYAPASPAGLRLLGHELAHVVQQRANNATTPAVIGAVDPAAELEAERAASGAIVPTARTGIASTCIQRRSIWEGIAGLFRGDDFPENELLSYLELLDRTGAIEDYTESDNKARAVVRRWKRGDSRFLLTPARKILLIREMFSGFTGNADEQAILDLLRGSPDAEFEEILSSIGEGEFHRQFHGEEQDQLDALLATRRGHRRRGSARPSESGAGDTLRERGETFPPETVLELQRRFISNAEATNRLNCIEIIRDIAPRLFADDPVLADRIRRRLGRLSGRTLTMPHLGEAMAELGLASAYRRIRFNNGNGRQQPTEMESSAWDAIVDMVGDVPGWHVFGLAVFDGYHSVTVLVENRADGPRLYWADQWRIDPGDDFHEEEGSASGFRRYERAGFDRFLNEYTESRWRRVLEEKGRRYEATLHIWKFRSSLSQSPSERPAGACEPWLDDS